MIRMFNIHNCIQQQRKICLIKAWLKKTAKEYVQQLLEQEIEIKKKTIRKQNSNNANQNYKKKLSIQNKICISIVAISPQTKICTLTSK